MYEKLGFLALAAELNEAFRKIDSAEIPTELHGPNRQTRVFLITPKSYHIRLSKMFYQKLVGGLHLFRRASPHEPQDLEPTGPNHEL